MQQRQGSELKSALSNVSRAKSRAPSMWRKMYDQNLLYQMDKAFKYNENVQ
jgi:hypothetical protein